MTACLLCTSPAVAEGLCVEDGARLWTSRQWQERPRFAACKVVPLDECDVMAERKKAQAEIDTLTKATAFLARLDAARAERDAKTCERPGCRKCLEER